MATMTLDELHDKHGKLEEGEIILDVRGPDEYREARIPGSLNIPHTEVTEHLDELKKYKTVYIHCRRGGRARQAYDALAQAGLNNLVCIDDAGMDAWLDRGYAHTKG